ncbi:hypothetical protein [Mesorhizobium loti]|uniref:hypothetical protein n=1 Tax=Rhizobium loti TaxID=381 RepID=UPI001268566A|nr:hypothetical protein [Mesorhizobium loti]
MPIELKLKWAKTWDDVDKDFVAIDRRMKGGSVAGSIFSTTGRPKENGSGRRPLTARAWRLWESRAVATPVRRGKPASLLSWRGFQRREMCIATMPTAPLEADKFSVL